MRSFLRSITLMATLLTLVSSLYAGSRQELLSKYNTFDNQEKISKKLRKQLENSFTGPPKEQQKRQQVWLEGRLDQLEKEAHLLKASSQKDNITDVLKGLDYSGQGFPPDYLDVQNYVLSPDEKLSAYFRITSPSSSSSTLNYELFFQGGDQDDHIMYGSKPVADFSVSNQNFSELVNGALLRTSWLKWAPNSRALAILSLNEGGHTDISVFSMGYYEKKGFLFFRKRVFVHDEVTIPITKDAENETCFVWGPSGDHLYYISTDGSYYSVWEYDLTRLTKQLLFESNKELYGLSWQKQNLYMFTYSQLREISHYCYLEDGHLQPLMGAFPGNACYAVWDATEGHISVTVNSSTTPAYVEVFDSESGESKSDMITSVYVPPGHRFYGAPYFADDFVIFPTGKLGSVRLSYYSITTQIEEDIGVTPGWLRELSELSTVRDNIYFRSLAANEDYFFQLSKIKLKMIPLPPPDEELRVHLNCLSFTGDTLRCHFPGSRGELVGSKAKTNLLDCRICDDHFGDHIIWKVSLIDSDRGIVFRSKYNLNFSTLVKEGFIHIRIDEKDFKLKHLKKADYIKIVNGNHPRPS